MSGTLPFPADERAPRDVILQGTVVERRYASPDGRFGVLTVSRETDDEATPVIGDVAGLSPGEDVRFRGRWEEHTTYGRRFRAEGWTPVLPSTRDGLKRFLGSGLIPGVGPALAERLVARFGDRTLDVITEKSARLREVSGIGKKRAEAITEAVRARRAEAESLTFLHALGIGPALSRKLLGRYGPSTVSVLRDDPYLAAEEVRGIGFRTADQIGRRAGIGVDDPRRAAGAVLHLVGQAADDGHCYVREPDLQAGAEKLDVPPALIADAVATLAAREMLVVDDERVYAPPLYRAEVALAERLSRLARPRAGREALSKDLPVDPSLSETQASAVRRSVTHGLMVLTGGPGTGKTTTVDSIVRAHEALDLRVTLVAPTGRAAKRMSEASGREARTIHRLLEWTPQSGGFNRNADNPLDTDLVLVDEASMLDLVLARALLEAVPPSASVIFVGDVDQLPPVGAGQVLREIIRSDIIPVARLHEVFRQAARSSIVRGAHTVLRGSAPASDRPGHKGTGDLFVVRAKGPAAITERLLSTLRRIPSAYGLDPRRDVQVLVPMRRGPLGTETLNQVLQAELNPGRGSSQLRPGDKVMQLRNDYEREVFNGDIGWVQRAEDGITYVRFDGGLRSYKPDELDALQLAYASTIHKSQGSEFPAVVLVLSGAHHVLLSRSLLYTAITRAQRLVVVVGEEAAIARAARTVRASLGRSHLAERLRALATAPAPRSDPPSTKR